MITGSAPISAPVKDFLRVVFGCTVVEGYGMTESSTAGAICHPEDLSNGHVGMPSPSVEVKLRDVAEMGYLANASPPRGEICMRGPTIFAGYFKMPDKTAEALAPDGWLYTGDIGEWTPQGQLRIIDRKKNIFKLAQGEYVAAEKIENIISRCPLVAQAFVYGDGLQSWLVAIIVPDPEESLKWAQAAGIAAGSDATPAAVAALVRAHGDALVREVHEQVRRDRVGGLPTVACRPHLPERVCVHHRYMRLAWLLSWQALRCRVALASIQSLGPLTMAFLLPLSNSSATTQRKGLPT